MSSIGRSLARMCVRGHTLLPGAILGAVFAISFAIRLFSVLRYESVIHEFDPYFNFRTTKFLSNEGFYAFHNFFDVRTWYPLGRNVGGTIYPGLMLTASVIYWIANALNISLNIRNACVFLAPLFSGFTAVATYLMAKEVVLGSLVGGTAAPEEAARVTRKATATGLISAALVAIVPGYISRSVAGSYDNEGVAIFALVFTFFLWIRAVNRGSMAWALATTISYFYMVSAWGGYVFIINLIPIHVLALLVSGRYSSRLYVAYSTFYCIGTLLSMQISFVGFQPVYSSEHLGALGVFGILQLRWLNAYTSLYMPRAEDLRRLRGAMLLAAVGATALAMVVGMATGYIAPWTGRFYSLLDPTYAKKYIPIIASVAEHQPTAWSSYFFDLHVLMLLMPAGLYFVLRKPNDASAFLVCYGTIGMYFSGVMVRLMLTLAPAACMIGGLALTEILYQHLPIAATVLTQEPARPAPPAKDTGAVERERFNARQRVISSLTVAGVVGMLWWYVFHCVWVTSEAYSSPSIVLAAKQPDGSRIIFDDYREAYYWLRMNTAEDAKVMSWWDYGYQLNAMANRTILVDNNTWNNTHIATVGRAMASSEDEAYQIMRSLDVDYVLVVFGGLTGYSGDDINKFLWMVRIGGGVFPQIKEPDYFSGGMYRIDRDAAPRMLNSLMYRLSYYRFGEMTTDYRRPTGYDRVRQAEIGLKDYKLHRMEEVFTSTHWILRIYKRVDPGNREPEYSSSHRV